MCPCNFSLLISYILFTCTFLSFFTWWGAAWWWLQSMLCFLYFLVINRPWPILYQLTRPKPRSCPPGRVLIVLLQQSTVCLFLTPLLTGQKTSSVGFTQLYWLIWFNIFTTLSINRFLSGLHDCLPFIDRLSPFVT